jgi:class 3 adenylate cyclase
MRPWTVDADDIQLREDFDPSILHHTPGVDEFLQPQGNKFFVLGTKGLGKTLLLKARRLAEQERMLCLPRNTLIDKPIGDQVMGSEMIALYGSSTENWRKLWRMAIAVATLKAVDKAAGSKVSARLAGLLDDPDLSGVMDHFVQMLDLPRSDFFRAVSDVDKYLIPRIRTLDSSVAIFIDSIDEYFNNHILELTPADAGELSPDIWYYAQMGLVEAVYELRRLTHHLKVFASIRKEAFDRFGTATPMVQQYRGSTVDIRYSRESLTEIFASNASRERPRNLADASRLKDDPVVAFLALTHVTHAHTGDVEEIGDYILRHTLGRPRDLMTIGGALSRVPPEPPTANTVKAVVNEAATEIAQEYLNEIAPFSGDLDLDALFLLLPRNVMTAEEAEALVRRYHRRVQGKSTTDSEILEFLHGVGLLGVVTTDHVAGSKIQHFLRPGQQSFDAAVPLPRSSHYFVHPILSDLVSRVNDDYIHNVDRTNVIGECRPWNDGRSEARLCVMKADIRGFSAIMASGADSDVHVLLHDIVQAHAAECPLAEVVEGDSLVIADENPRTILKVAKRIMQDLYEAPGNPELRVAIDCGAVEMHPGRRLVTTGTPFRVAARLEPHVAPGQIWVTEEFKDVLGQRPGLYKAVPLKDGDPESAPELLNIKKPGSAEPDELIAVHRIVDSA